MGRPYEPRIDTVALAHRVARCAGVGQAYIEPPSAPGGEARIVAHLADGTRRLMTIRAARLFVAKADATRG